MEFVLIIAFVLIARRLRQASRAPQRPMRIDVYHHVVPGPGERRPAGEVVPFRPRIVG